MQDYGAVPQLFFHNQHNAYTLALDPEFMRAHSEQKYRVYFAVLSLREDPRRARVRSLARATFILRILWGAPSER